MTVPLPALLLAATFGWAAFAKATRPGAWRDALGGYGIPKAVHTAAFAGVPLAEAAVVALLAAGGDAAKAGGALAVGLLAAFSLAVVRARASQGDRLPCGCFGGAGRRDFRLMLVRNGVLGVVAGAVLLAPDALSLALPAPTAAQAIPAALTGLGVGLVVWLAVAAGRSARG